MDRPRSGVRRREAVNKLYEVTHQCFATDHISYTRSVVEAKNKIEALAKYNNLAKQRTEYPYMWNETTDIEDVSELEIIR